MHNYACAASADKWLEVSRRIAGRQKLGRGCLWMEEDR